VLIVLVLLWEWDGERERERERERDYNDWCVLVAYLLLCAGTMCFGCLFCFGNFRAA
jgi:hypothetical protein